MEAFFPFLLTSVIIELTPGPNMAYLAILSITEGRRAGFAAVAGITLGLLTIGMAAALGVATLISNSTFAYETLRWCGVFYMLWLAWDGWNTGKETSPDKTDKEIRHLRFFKRGFLTNILNPKAAVFYVAILPTFIGSASNVPMQAAILTMIYVCIATIVHSTIVTLAGTVRGFLGKPRHVLITRRILSILLIGVALWIAISTREISF